MAPTNLCRTVTRIMGGKGISKTWTTMDHILGLHRWAAMDNILGLHRWAAMDIQTWAVIHCQIMATKTIVILIVLRDPLHQLYQQLKTKVTAVGAFLISCANPIKKTLFLKIQIMKQMMNICPLQIPLQYHLAINMAVSRLLPLHNQIQCMQPSPKLILCRIIIMSTKQFRKTIKPLRHIRPKMGPL